MDSFMDGFKLKLVQKKPLGIASCEAVREAMPKRPLCLPSFRDALAFVVQDQRDWFKIY